MEIPGDVSSNSLLFNPLLLEYIHTYVLIPLKKVEPMRRRGRRNNNKMNRVLSSKLPSPKGLSPKRREQVPLPQRRLLLLPRT
jgi:hypothetical protein